MTKKTLFGIISAVCLLALAACSNTPQNNETSLEKGSRELAKQPLAKAIGDVKKAEFEVLQKDFDKIATEDSSHGFLTAAMENETCKSFDAYHAYESLEQRYDHALLDKPEFLATLKSNTRSAAQSAGAAAYKQMKAGRPLGCGGREVSEVYTMEKFGEMMDKYGPPEDTEKFDTKVFRAAYLRAIKPEIQESIAAWKRSPDSGDIEGALAGKIEEAQFKWHFTFVELGVPADIAKKLQL